MPNRPYLFIYCFFWPNLLLHVRKRLAIITLLEGLIPASLPFFCLIQKEPYSNRKSASYKREASEKLVASSRYFSETKAQKAGMHRMQIFYALGLMGGIAFGWLQCRFLVWIINYQGKARPAFLMVKLLLWAVCMVLLALWSIPVLICFVVGATAAMLISLFVMRRHSKEE